MIAGFEVPDEGRILLHGEDVTPLFSNRRPVNMVFQQYALFPHMSIYDNVAFGLKVKRVPRARAPRARRSRCCAWSSWKVSSVDVHDNSPAASSSASPWPGRSSTSPAALLLDEPLGALDVKLRKQMQLELKRIQHELGHDVRLRHP